MKNIVLIALFFYTLLGCNQVLEKPDDLLSEGKMKAIVTDFYLYQNTNLVTKKPTKIKYEEINAAILQKHKVTLEQFKQSQKYYIINELNYADMLQEIVDSLQKIKPDPKEIELKKSKSDSAVSNKIFIPDSLKKKRPVNLQPKK